MQLLAALSAGATSALLVVLAGRHLGVGPDGFGLLLGAIGVSAALGPLPLACLVSNPRRPAWVFGPLLRGLVDLLLATTRSLAWRLGRWPSRGRDLDRNGDLQLPTPSRGRPRGTRAGVRRL